MGSADSGFGRLEELFHQLQQESVAERERLLAELAETDAELSSTLAELLAAASGPDGLLDTTPLPRGAWGGDLTPGTVVDGFVVEDLVASGGMGAVYRARQERPRRDVALKILRAGARERSHLMRFELEAEILGTLDHPGIASVHAAGVSEINGEALPYIVMELVDGTDLVHYVREQALDERAIARLMIEVCEAVAHAHQRGIIHRDLKPSNVLVRSDGRPKVLDFGVARVRGRDLPAGDQALARGGLQTQAGQIVGTVAYMSPEQARGDRDAVGTRTDVWALGVILYELHVGSRPFETAELPLAEVLRTIQEDPPPALRAEAGLDEDLACILGRALAKEPEDRYAGPGSLAEDLGRWLRHEPVQARPATLLYRARRFVRRNPVLTATSVVAFGLMVTGIVMILQARERADEAAVEAGHRAREATEARSEIASLSDQRRLEELEARALTLVPPHPDRADPMKAWLRDAEALLSRLESHRRTRERLEQRAVKGGPDAEVRFEKTEDAWHHECLVELIAGLEDFGDESGAVARIAWQLDRAERIFDETITRHAAAWQRARAEVRDSAVYRDLELEPQIGLIPLGADAASGLQEFIHWLTHDGSPPTRTKDGLELAESSGIVFVLIPGGETRLGAQRGSPDEPHFDRLAESSEVPVHTVSLAPYFIAKHEVTQVQWERVAGSNPSAYPMGRKLKAPADQPRLTGRHPVESVSWHEAQSYLTQLGLCLPTEAQWEHAARGGRETAWFTGKEADDLAGFVNIADRAALRAGSRWPGIRDWAHHDDGFCVHAPVGSFGANAFGLHDCFGNVREWCLDPYDSYRAPTEPGTGYRRTSRRERCLRGGDFTSRPMDVRSGNRHGSNPDAKSQVAGFRAARLLDPRPR